jgi:menaquinone-dependent protoporphyrinogen oxidase
MNRVLVTYASMAGSTAEVAQAVAEELAKCGWQAEVVPLEQVQDLQAYEAVVVGGPMIMGWHRAAARFLKRNRATFQRMPLAVFVTAMSLTQDGETRSKGESIYVDPNLPKLPQKAGSLSFQERYARLSNYLRPILQATRPAKPASIGVFGGRLEYGRLKWWAVLFAMLVIQAPAGERRNWSAIREWAAGLPEKFQPQTVSTKELV